MSRTRPSFDRAGLAAALGTHAVWGSMPLYLLLVKSVPAVEYVAWRILFTLPLCGAIILWRKAGAEVRAVLRDTDLPITDIAFQTGWGSLGTFGRTFRDITGESPGDFRARMRATPHALAQAPACYVSAALRPGLTIAVSEKRRQAADGDTGAPATEDIA